MNQEVWAFNFLVISGEGGEECRCHMRERERQGRKTSREKPRDRSTEEPVTAAAGRLRLWVPGPLLGTA